MAKRTRHVVKTGEVAHLWAAQAQSDARNGSGYRFNFSFRGLELISYTTPIARIVEPCTMGETGGTAGIVLHSTRRWSVTTSAQQHDARLATRHFGHRFEVADIHASNTEDHLRNLNDYIERVAAIREKGKRAHKVNRPRYASDALALEAEAADYTECFGLESSLDRNAIERQLNEYRQERAIAEALREQVAEATWAEKHAKLVPLWRAGEAVDVYGWGVTMLRLVGEEVETSKGARVPVAAARLLFAAWRAGVVKLGQHIGPYTVRSVSDEGLEIGCHYLTREEVTMFAAGQGWTA